VGGDLLLQRVTRRHGFSELLPSDKWVESGLLRRPCSKTSAGDEEVLKCLRHCHGWEVVWKAVDSI
jgi:hypothetical protein